MAPKKESIKKKVSVVEPPPAEPEKPPLIPKYGDPIEGESEPMNSQQKFEEKAQPIRTWLEKNIVGILLQALSALVAHRPSNPHEFLAAYLLKYNPLKPAYPAEDAQLVEKPEGANGAPDGICKDPSSCPLLKKKGSLTPDGMMCNDPCSCPFLKKKGSLTPDGMMCNDPCSCPFLKKKGSLTPEKAAELARAKKKRSCCARKGSVLAKLAPKPVKSKK